MTYAELAELINDMTEEEKGQDVTVHVSGVGEFYTLLGDYPVVTSNGESEALDVGHYYLQI